MPNRPRSRRNAQNTGRSKIRCPWNTKTAEISIRSDLASNNDCGNEQTIAAANTTPPHAYRSRQRLRPITSPINKSKISLFNNRALLANTKLAKVLDTSAKDWVTATAHLPTWLTNKDDRLVIKVLDAERAAGSRRVDEACQIMIDDRSPLPDGIQDLCQHVERRRHSSWACRPHGQDKGRKFPT